MFGKMYSPGDKQVFVDSLVDSFLKGLRVSDLDLEPANWVKMGLKDLENDSDIKSLLERKADLQEIESRCRKVITVEKIESYFAIDDPSNI